MVALCQILPVPGSSQVGIAIGRLRGGAAGAVTAWLDFTLPSVLLLVAFAYGFTHLSDTTSLHLLRGLKIAAVAVVVQAVWSMGRMLCPDRARATIAAASAITVILLGAAYGQTASIVAAGIAGAAFLKSSTEVPRAPLGMPGSKAGALACLAAFALLLFGLPTVAAYLHSYPLDLFSAFYRVGSLVFGGGHAVLPLLEAVVVPRGWVPANTFMAGYGAAQTVPGPLFLSPCFSAPPARVSRAGYGRLTDRYRGDLSAFIPAGRRGAASMGRVARVRANARRHGRHQRRCGRHSTRRAVRPRVDQRSAYRARFRAGRRGPGPARLVASAVVGGRADNSRARVVGRIKAIPLFCQACVWITCTALASPVALC